MKFLHRKFPNGRMTNFQIPAFPTIGAVPAVMTWLMIALLSILMLPFGWQVAVANILLDVTAETTPPGCWEVQLIEAPASEELEVAAPPLMHKVYENPRVQETLCEWIETRGSVAAS